MKKKYRGVYNVHGELTTLYVWAYSKKQAHLLFKKQLEEIYQRKLYFKYINFTIKEEL